MNNSLRSRLQRLELRDEAQATGGLYIFMSVPEDQPLPESYSVGGLRVVYARKAEIDVARAEWGFRSWFPQAAPLG